MDPVVSHQRDWMAGLAELADELSHELINQLGVILNARELLERRLTDERAKSDLHTVRMAAEEAVLLSRSLGKLAGRAMIDPERIDLNDVVRGLAATLASDDANVQINLDLADIPLQVVVDRGGLDQIIVAIATNALQAMPTGGSLTIKTRPHAATHRVVLQLSDDGCGMTHEVRRRATEPFFTTKERVLGTGLGLALVDRYVGLSGGEVRIESEPGIGTTVTVTFPNALDDDGDREAHDDG